jgi:transposase
MNQMIAVRPWLTVVLLPAYAPDQNPTEWVWAHLKHSPANLTACTLDQLETLIRNRLKSLQYRPATVNGFIAGTSLTLESQPP